MSSLRPRRLSTQRRQARGFTLIEVLVSLVIFGVGLMGLGKMLMVSMKSNGSSYSRAQAMALANAMLDRMRANRTTALQGAASNYSVPTLTSSIGAAPDCLGGSCSGPQLATYDVVNWLANLTAASGLPSGQGRIVFATLAAQTTVTVTIQWDDSVAQNALKEGVTPVSVSLTSAL